MMFARIVQTTWAKIKYSHSKDKCWQRYKDISNDRKTIILNPKSCISRLPKHATEKLLPIH